MKNATALKAPMLVIIFKIRAEEIKLQSRRAKEVIRVAEIF